jgi:hypothetical protein
MTDGSAPRLRYRHLGGGWARVELQAYRAREARLEAAVQRAEDVLSPAGAQ